MLVPALSHRSDLAKLISIPSQKIGENLQQRLAGFNILTQSAHCAIGQKKPKSTLNPPPLFEIDPEKPLIAYKVEPLSESPLTFIPADLISKNIKTIAFED